eukprot:1139572-Pelagomonas_calceolata.AAC.1
MILPSWQSNVQACPAHMFGKHEDLDTSQGSDDSLFEQRGMKSSSACNHMRATTMSEWGITLAYVPDSFTVHTAPASSYLAWLTSL